MIDLTTYALLRKQITSAVSGVSDVRAEGDELVFVLEDGREVRVAIPATEIRDAVVRDDVLVLTLADDKEVVVDATLTQSGQAADAKTTGDAVSQLKGDLAAEQTAREEADNTLRADLTANTNADAETKRSLNALWKLNQGISYQFETDNTAVYRKTVPSGAKLASVENVGGKTVVWNQPWQYTSKVTENNNIKITTEDAHFTIVVNNPIGSVQATVGRINLTSEHKYLFMLDKEIKTGIEFYATGMPVLRSGRYKISTPDNRYIGNQAVLLFVGESTANGTYEYNAKIIDLTQLFGAGNEPTDTSDSRIAWIEQYAAAHPEYNAGELISADVESVEEIGRNLCNPVYNIGIYANRYVVGLIKVKKNTKYYITCSAFKINPSFDIKGFSNDEYIDNPTAEYIWTAGKQIAGDTSTFDSDKYEYIGLRVWGENTEYGLTDDSKFCVSEVNVYSPYRENDYYIPGSVRTLPGYGWSAGDVYNSIERTETGWQYVQRVGEYVFDGTENWIARDVGYCYFTNKHFDNGVKKDVANFLTNAEGEYRTIRVRSNGNGLIAKYRDANVTLTLDEVNSRFSSGKILHYEYETPIITDITDLMADFPAYFEVEAGGTITIENTAMLPVPSTEKYLIALAEVNG